MACVFQNYDVYFDRVNTHKYKSIVPLGIYIVSHKFRIYDLKIVG